MNPGQIALLTFAIGFALGELAWQVGKIIVRALRRRRHRAGRP